MIGRDDWKTLQSFVKEKEKKIRSHLFSSLLQPWRNGGGRGMSWLAARVNREGIFE